MKNNFEKHYPNLSWWIETHGWVEIGMDEYYRDSWLRILDEGGVCWQDKKSETLDDALLEAEVWLSLEIEDRFGEKPPKDYGAR